MFAASAIATAAVSLAPEFVRFLFIYLVGYRHCTLWMNCAHLRVHRRLLPSSFAFLLLVSLQNTCLAALPLWMGPICVYQKEVYVYFNIIYRTWKYSRDKNVFKSIQFVIVSNFSFTFASSLQHYLIISIYFSFAERNIHILMIVLHGLVSQCVRCSVNASNWGECCNKICTIYTNKNCHWLARLTHRAQHNGTLCEKDDNFHDELAHAKRYVAQHRLNRWLNAI